MKRGIIITVGIVTLVLGLSACSTLPTGQPDLQKLGDLYQQGETAYQAGDLETAQQHYQQALKADPNHMPSYFRLGNIAARKGDFAAAERYYQQVLKQMPEHPKAHYNLALLGLMQVQKHLQYYQQWEKGANQAPNPQIADVLLAIEALSDVKPAVTTTSPKKP